MLKNFKMFCESRDFQNSAHAIFDRVLSDGKNCVVEAPTTTQLALIKPN